MESMENNNNNNICAVPITINQNDVIEGARSILKVIRPLWNQDTITFKLFTDGITNKLVGCFNQSSDGKRQQVLADDDGAHHKTFPSPPVKENVIINQNDEVILVRIYGNKTDLLIDRDIERQNIIFLHSHGFAPALYATFTNGLAYEYVPGVTLTPDTVIDSKVWPLIAKHMAKLHKIQQTNVFDQGSTAAGQYQMCHKHMNINETLGDALLQLVCTCKIDLINLNHNNNNYNRLGDHVLKNNLLHRRAPLLWNKVQQFVCLIPEQFSNPTTHERLSKCFPNAKQLQVDFTELYKHLENLNSPIVFCHNDLLLGNVIYNESESKVTFIDYEYAGYNFQAYDIGNHFTEFVGIDIINYNRYPSKEFQQKWLRVYLETFRNNGNNSSSSNEVTDEDVELLYIQVNAFALASHFFWAVWALIQCEHSTIDFDFIGFAQARYNEYLARKTEFLSLTNAIDG